MSEGLTVVIPCRGVSRLLTRCVATLVQQWAPDFPGEIIIVDDGSGDSYDHLYNDVGVVVRVIRMDEQTGPGACRNAGVLAAANDWIAFVDDDCLMPWGWLVRVREIMSDATPRLVGGRLRSRRPQNWWSQAMEDFVLNPTWQEGAWHVVTANCVVHRMAWAAIDGFDTRYTFAGGEDWDFSERMHASGHLVVHDPDLWCFHENATTPGPFFERAVRYGRAHAQWRSSRQEHPAVAGVRRRPAAVSLVRRKGSFLFRRYLELRAREVPRTRSLRSTAAFGTFVAVFDFAAFRETRRIRDGAGAERG